MPPARTHHEGLARRLCSHCRFRGPDGAHHISERLSEPRGVVPQKLGCHKGVRRIDDGELRSIAASSCLQRPRTPRATQITMRRGMNAASQVGFSRM